MNTAPATGADSRLVRAVGVLGLAAGIVNITIGGGIFRLPASAAREVGMAAPIAYVLCAIVMMLVVLCFAEAGSRVSLTGGLYAYVEVAFGPLAGFVMGVLLWAGLTAATAAVTSFFADSIVALTPGGNATAIRLAAIVAAIAGYTAINIRGVRGASGVNTVMTVAKLLPLLILIGVGLFSLDSSRFTFTDAPPLPKLTGASAILIFAFLGVESALVPSGEVRSPERTVPRAIFLAIAVVTLIYLAIQLVAQSALGAGLGESQTPVADAAGVVLGGWGRTMILIGSSVSMLGYIGGMTLSVPRLLFAFARDGFLPSPLATTHSRFSTPYVAIVVQSVVHLVLALTGTWSTLAYIANGAVLLMYLACCAATMELRRRGVTTGQAAFAVPGGPIIPLLALMAVLWLLAGIPLGELKAVAAVVVVAAAVYGIAKRFRGSEPGEQRF
jgi:APA family basic amino acid/polyamine antiporter